jgi:hypothetical protein
VPLSARRRRAGPLAAALVTGLAAAALGGAACTLIVDSKLDSLDAGPSDAGDAGCEDQGFDDGSLADGGARIFLHTGIAGPFAFHGRAFFRPGDDAWAYAPTVAAFASDAGVFALGAQEPGGARPGFRLNDLLPDVSALALTAGHIGASGSPCGEVLATTLDTLHDTAGIALWSAGCTDLDTTDDAGVYTPRSVAADTGIGWSSLDGGRLGVELAGEGHLCWDTGRIYDCGAGVPGQLVGRGPRAIEGLEGTAGGLIWVTSAPGVAVALQSGSFSPVAQVTVPSGAVVPLAADIALGLEAAGSILNARAFSTSGALLGAAAQFYTGDATTIVSSTLAATSYGSAALVRVAWVGSDGKGRVLDLDASDPANLHLAAGHSAPRLVCGGAVRFVAPVSSKWVVVAAGEGLAVRPAP